MTFELAFEVAHAEAASLSLGYAVDDVLRSATLNGRSLEIGISSGARQCGGEATIVAPQVRHGMNS